MSGQPIQDETTPDPCEFLFGGVFEKPVKASFDAPELSSNGGALLVGGLDRTLGLSRLIARALPDLRDPGRIEHTVEKMIRQLLTAQCCGHADFNDGDKLRNDPVLKLSCDGPDGSLASAPTLCRLANSCSPKDHLRVGLRMAAWMLGSQARRRDRVRWVTIDLDPTDIPVHGQQMFAFFNGHYDCHCLLPMLCFVTFHRPDGSEETEHWLAGALLRSGKAHATHGAGWMLRRIVAMLRDYFPGVRVRVRLDGGYACPEILDTLEELRVSYVVGLASNSVLDPMAEPLRVKAREEAARTGMTARVYGEVMYKAHSWGRSRRVIVKAEVLNNVNGEKENTRYVVTNLSETAEPQRVYEDIYCNRGEIENRIKELHDVELRTSSTAFAANQFRLNLAVASYMLMQELGARYCAHAAPGDRPQVSRLRELLLKLGAVVREVKRMVRISLPDSAPAKRLWCLIAKSICVPT